eukprot:4868100-Pyramimonas_sp.AAC.1
MAGLIYTHRPVSLATTASLSTYVLALSHTHNTFMWRLHLYNLAGLCFVRLDRASLPFSTCVMPTSPAFPRTASSLSMPSWSRCSPS